MVVLTRMQGKLCDKMMYKKDRV